MKELWMDLGDRGVYFDSKLNKFFIMPHNITTDFKIKPDEHYYHAKYSIEKKEIPSIKNVIFNDPATIVFWEDGTKTIAKCDKFDTFDEEKGLMAAMLKKYYGSKDFNKIIKKWCENE